MSFSTLKDLLTSLDRLRTTEDGQRLSWRDGALFSDWVLSWGDPQSPNAYKVHRVILVGGPRPAHYFGGAVRHEDLSTGATDLSLLLPEECKTVFDTALDFIYGNDLPHLEPDHAALLFKVAPLSKH